MVTISKGPAKIMDNRMKRISKNFALTLTHKLDIFQLAKSVSLQIKMHVRDDSIKHIDIADSKGPFTTNDSLILPEKAS